MTHGSMLLPFPVLASAQPAHLLSSLGQWVGQGGHECGAVDQDQCNATHLVGWIGLIWVKQCHKPPMTGNGKHTKHTTYKNGDDWGMVYDVYGIVSPTLINFNLRMGRRNRIPRWKSIDEVYWDLMIKSMVSRRVVSLLYVDQPRGVDVMQLHVDNGQRA